MVGKSSYEPINSTLSGNITTVVDNFRGLGNVYGSDDNEQELDDVYAKKTNGGSMLKTKSGETVTSKEDAMNVMASLKWVEYASKACGTLLGKVSFCSLIGASMSLYLGIGTSTAAAATLEQTVGPLQVDFLYPNTMTDLNLGTYDFPSPGQEVSVPFGVGVQTDHGTPASNIFELKVTPTAFDIIRTDPFPFRIAIANNANVIIKVTTPKSSLINLVSLQSETGITLNPGSFLYGSNFFQVDLGHNSYIDPGATLNFSASYNVSGSPVPDAVPEPSSLLGYITLGGLMLGSTLRKAFIRQL